MGHDIPANPVRFQDVWFDGVLPFIFAHVDVIDANLLGRVSSLWMLQAMGEPALGTMQAGLLARAAPLRFALICGSAVSVAAAAIIARMWPSLRNSTVT